MKLFSLNEEHTQQDKKSRLPLGAWLSYLLVVSLIFTGVSFSRFATTTSADDSARVAKFAVSVINNENLAELELTAGSEEPGEYKIGLKNDSEVRVRFQIQVTGVPEGVTVNLGGTEKLTPSDDDDGKLVSEWRGLDFETQFESKLTFTAGEDAEAVTDADVQIKALVEQVD